MLSSATQWIFAKHSLRRLTLNAHTNTCRRVVRWSRAFSAVPRPPGSVPSASTKEPRPVCRFLQLLLYRRQRKSPFPTGEDALSIAQRNIDKGLNQSAHLLLSVCSRFTCVSVSQRTAVVTVFVLGVLLTFIFLSAWR